MHRGGGRPVSALFARTVRAEDALQDGNPDVEAYTGS
jgi:hypothetical protein